MQRGVRSRFLVTTAFVSAIALAACGGGSSPKSAAPGVLKLISATPDRTAAAKTARFNGGVAVETGGQTVDLQFDGAFDFSTRAASITMDLGQLGLPLGGGGRVEVRVVDGVLYMNLGGLAGAAGSGLSLPAGKSWMKLDVNGLVQSAGGSGSGRLGALGGADPSGALDALRGVSSDVEDLGAETIRGTETTHYRVHLDLAKALQQVPPDLRNQVKEGLDALGTGTIPADVWIGADGMLRKLTMTMDGSKLGTKGGSVGVTFELYDFGAAVDVHAPPADQTADFGDVLGGLVNGVGSGSGSS
jgi:hypothetical protein